MTAVRNKDLKYKVDTVATGKRIKQIRKANKVTIHELSEESGLSRGLISETETGNNKPSANLLIALIRMFDANIHWILTGEGEMYFKAEIERHLPDPEKEKEEFSDLYHKLLWYLDKAPVVRYAIMGFFTEFMHQYKEKVDDGVETPDGLDLPG